MLSPNFNLLLWVILFIWIIQAIANIIVGITGQEMRKNYTLLDTIIGIIQLIVALYIVTS